MRKRFFQGPIPNFIKLNNNFNLILLLLLQQLIIFLPVFSDKFIPHRFGDDFTVANSGVVNQRNLDFYPNSISDWFSRIRSRYYLNETMRLIIFGLNENYHIIAVLFCVVWIISLTILLYSTPNFWSYKMKLVFILLVGAAPYRQEFMLLPQGDGYILVLFLLSVSLLLIKKSFEVKERWSVLFVFTSFVTFYLSLYLYEVGSVASIGFTLAILFTKNHPIKNAVYKYSLAFSYPLVTLFHSTIIITSTNQMWNRSNLRDLSFLEIIGYGIDFTKNYVLSLVRPFASIARNDHEILRFFKVMFQQPLFTVLVIAFVAYLYTNMKEAKLPYRKVLKFKEKNKKVGMVPVDLLGSKLRNLTLAIISTLLLTPYLGFLTFSGSFPTRLLLIPTLGISALITVVVFSDQFGVLAFRKSVRFFTLLLILFFTFFSSYFIQSLNSVSKYDQILTNEIIKTLKNDKDIVFPVLINFPIPACQEVGFWRWNPSIWESGAGNLTLADALGKLNGQENQYNQVFYLPRNIPRNGNSISTNANDISSCSLTQSSKTYFGYFSQPVQFDRSLQNNFQYTFDNQLKMRRLFR